MRKPDIHLEKVTEDNVEAIVDLNVSKEQRKFVASNNWSLIDAYLSLAEGKPVFPFGIYNGKTLVGFIMISYDNDWTGYERDAWLNSENYRFYRDKYYYYIWRFMIDKRFQGRGYGREALRLALEFVRTFPCGEAEYCVLSYEPTNEAAKRFYGSFGFEELNEPGYYEDDDEISAVMKL
ncbi:MAG: GNAT family N-acetyltransferase [Erysipelotrichaceae bacterium]|nr:GNAT family N-acetyltransferase [Erysipelotrichaceae bacterium]